MPEKLVEVVWFTLALHEVVCTLYHTTNYPKKWMTQVASIQKVAF